MRYGYVDYHTPNQPEKDGVAGQWRFEMADDVVFSAAWGAAVHDFISDPVNAEEARQRGHGLNYGDFIEFGVEHLERHGLRRVDEPYGQHITVDHDAVLVEPDEQA